MTWPEWIDSGQWRVSKDIGAPMLPALVADVMPMVTDPDVSVLRLARIIAKEQMLATRVLRMANSAYCAPMQEITTINDAIVRMGTSSVRNVVFAVCVSSRLQSDVYGSQGRELADHGVGTAYLARLVAEHAGFDPDEAFIQGLLHDVGKLLLLKLARDFTKFGGVLASQREVDACVAERHATFGAEILREWQLPSRLQEPVRFHHNPDAAGEFRDQADITYVANRLSHRYGFGCPADDPDDLMLDAVSVRLGLTPDWLAQIDRRAPGMFAVARQIVS
jgi:putative nucleotidyltransferase with HDIG domain